MPAKRLVILVLVALLLIACGSPAAAPATQAPATAVPAQPTAAAKPADSGPAALATQATTAPAGAQPTAQQPATKPVEQPAVKPTSGSPVARPAATPTAGTVARAEPTPARKFEIQKPGEIQQPGPWPTLAPYVYPTIGPFQVPGEIQKPGEFRQPPPYVWPTIGEFQRPGPIQVPGEIQKPGEFQVIAGVPKSADCLQGAKVMPNGHFTGESFKLEVPKGGGDCQVPAGLILKSAEGLQDMLVMATVKVNNANGSDTVTVFANCTDVNKHGPEPTSKYSVGGTVPASSPLGKLIAGLPKVPSDKVTVPGLQAAVWSITNDISRVRMAKIMTFEDKDLASARVILETAGIETQGKALFK